MGRKYEREKSLITACAWRGACYIANDLQLVRCHFKLHGKAGFAALLIFLILLLNAMAACPGLHELIHHDADAPGHECAVTLLAHGHLDTATVAVAAVLPVASIETSPQIIFSVFSSPIELLPAGRAPPVVVPTHV